MGNDVFGLIYTGESSMQLRDLTYSRSVAAVPFAGRYRCIDFIMSNLVNTGISNVGIIAQKNYHSLMDHLGSGKEWELHRKRDGLFILPPFVTRDNTGIYRGTIDAYHSVMGYIRRSSQKYIIISGSHTVFNTTFDDMIAQHIRTGANITFMYNEVGIHHPDDQFNELRFNLAVLCLSWINGFQPEYTGKTLIIACLASIAFLTLEYCVNFFLDIIGDFILLVFMVLQLSGCAGTYPLELSDKFYQVLNPFMPFTYTVHGFRSGIASGLDITTDCVVLAVIAVVFAGLLLVGFRKRAKKEQESEVEVAEKAISGTPVQA